MNDLMINLAEEGIKPTNMVDEEIKFDTGYESYEFYKAIVKTAKKRLYIYGRKNRKLFTRNVTAIKKLINNGVDFKCLFLSDKADSNVLNMAQENDNFKEDLLKVINNVKEKFNDNLDCFRKYDFQQTKRIIIVDDAIIFVPVLFEMGKVKHFTKTEFSIIPLDSIEGMKLEKEFNKVWEVSKTL